MGRDQSELETSLRLHNCFGEMAALLQGVEAMDWLRTIQDLDTFGNDPDQEELRAILGMFGGMGSINDWVISSRNHHKVDGENVSALNDRLEALRTEVFDLASSLLDGPTVGSTHPTPQTRHRP